MTINRLSSASSILKRGSLSEHLDIPGTFSEHPASPVLLTSEGPQKTQATRQNLSPLGNQSGPLGGRHTARSIAIGTSRVSHLA